MKRSEMKKYIEDTLYCHVNTHDEHISVIAEAILQTIEGGNPSGSKMLPPTIISLPDQYNRTEGTYGFEINEWEKE